MKDNEKFLPHNWIIVNIEEIAVTSSGGTPKRSDSSYYGGNIPWVKSGELRDGEVNDISESITEDGLKNSSAKIFPEGTLCIAMYGATVGKVGILTCDAATNQAVCALFLSKYIDTKYIFYLLKNIRKDLIATSKGGAQPNISQFIIKKTQIPLAPFNEQKDIAKKIEILQAKSKKAKKALETAKPLLDKLRQSILASAFRGDLTADWRKNNPDVEPASILLERIRIERRKKWEENELAKMRAKGKEPKDDKWKSKYKEPELVDNVTLSELPAGWCWASLGRIFEVCVGATPRRKELSYWNGNVPWVSSGEVAFCRINNTIENITKLGLENTSTRIHPPGTILIGMIGEGKTRGQVAILDIEACNNQNSAAIRVSETQILPEYVYRYLEEQYVKTRTLGSGNNQPALNKTRVQNMMIPIAPIDEQNKIVVAVEKQIKAVGKLSRHTAEIIQDISILDSEILRKAFEGELVTQDSSDEAASVLLERIRTEI